MSIRVSADERLEGFLREIADVDTAFGRVARREPRCNFGLQGVCCRLCSNGPCRVSSKSARGVCGADADTIVARNFLRSVAAGAACYLHVAENAANVLREAGPPYGGDESLQGLATVFGIQAADSQGKAKAIAEMVIADLYKPRWEEMELTEKLAHPPRFKRWRELGIVPGGAKAEVFDALVKSSTNLSSDPFDMLFHCLRLGIATGLYGLTMTNHINDILLGEPVMTKTKVGFSVANPGYINIMVIGHQPALLGGLLYELSTPEAERIASDAGAKGFKVIGSTCVGQEIESRCVLYADVFAGHAGNNFSSEPMLATGLIDLVVTDFNCALPGIEGICERFSVTQVCIDEVSKKRNAEYLGYRFDGGRALARRVMEAAASSYTGRRRSVKINLPEHGYDGSVTGIGEKSLKALLGGTLKPLIELIHRGRIKGIVGIVGCSNMRAGGHDVLTNELARELIGRDIVVLTAGCTSAGLANCGMTLSETAGMAGEGLRRVCELLEIPPILNFGSCLGIGRLERVAAEMATALSLDIPDLPLAVSAPQ